MQLDRFTEKAQEAILAAQRLAEHLQSPVLDAEHLLAALVEPDDGVPAETLRRLGVGPAGVPRRARRASSRGAPDPGRQPDPRPARAKRVIDRPRRRPGASTTSTSRPSTCCSASPRSAARPRQLLERHGAGREALLQALQSVRGGQRVTSQNPETTYQALEKYGRDLTAEARAGKLDPVIGRDEEIRRVDPGPLAAGPRTTRC